MEIIQIYHYDPCSEGNSGILRHVHSLLKFLPKKGIDITLFGIKNKECDLKYDKLNFVPIIRGPHSGLRYFMMLFIKLIFFKINDETVIHIHHPLYVLPFLIVHKKNPIVLTLHWERSLLMKSGFKNKIWKFSEFLVFKRTNEVVSVSKKVEKSFSNIYPEILNKCTVISIGIDLKKFKPMSKMDLRSIYGIKKEKKVVLYAGVLETIKNIDLLIKSFCKLSKVYDVQLLIVGKGRCGPNLKKLTKKLKLENKIKFLGEVPYSKMPEIYNCADIFALPSKIEAAPTVVREALACGIPVISNNVGDVENLVMNNLTGYLVNKPTEKEFYFGMETILKKLENNQKEISQQCIDMSNNYSFEYLNQKYIEIYRKLSNNK